MTQSAQEPSALVEALVESAVERVAPEFYVHTGARQALVDQGLTGAEDLAYRVGSQETQEEEVLEGLVQLLRVAMNLAKEDGRGAVDLIDATRAMQRACFAKPWC